MAKTIKAFSFAALFTGASIAASFDEGILKDARNGRINAAFISLVDTCDGIKVPVSKVAFDKFSRDFITQEKCSIRAYSRGNAYREAFALIRDTMGLATLAGPDWAPVRKVKPATVAPVAVAVVAPESAAPESEAPESEAPEMEVSVLVDTVISAIRAGMLSADEIESIRVAMAIVETPVNAVSDAVALH